MTAHGTGMPDIVRDMIARAAADNGVSVAQHMDALRNKGTVHGRVRKVDTTTIALSERETTVLALLAKKGTTE